MTQMQPTPREAKDDAKRAETLDKSLLRRMLSGKAAAPAPQSAPVSDPYGLGTYTPPEHIPTIPAEPADPRVSVDPVAGAQSVPTLAETQGKMLQGFSAPAPNLDPAKVAALGLEGFARVLPSGAPGVLCAGLAKSGDRCLIRENGAERWVNLGRQVSPGVWTVIIEGEEMTHANVCPGIGHCRSHGWQPGTPSCLGWDSLSPAQQRVNAAAVGGNRRRR